MSEETVKIKIEITKTCHEKLKEQLQFFAQSKLKEFENISTEEELIAKYLEQMTSCEDQYKLIQSKMQDVMSVLNEKGVDILELFNSLNDQFEDDKKRKKEESRVKKS